jgi:ketosteroid isomerase-like protein
MDNIELVRVGYDAFARGDRAKAHELCAPDVEWHPALGALLAQEVYRGPDEVVRVIFEEIPSVLTGFRSELLEIRELDDERVLGVARFGGTAASSGVEVDQVFGQVFTCREGRLVEMRSYPSKAEALDAASTGDVA